MQINYAKKEVSCKLVYYGPGMSGKTTNLEIIHEKVPDQNKGEMTSIATEGDRTLFFDFLPLDLGKVRGMSTKFQLYTVPGQVYYSSTRKLVLQGADGVIFVADSQAEKLAENIESLKDLEKNLDEYGLKLNEIPLVIQWNKRDLPSAMDVNELDKEVNWPGAATTEAVAAMGDGVLPTLKLAASIILERLNSKEPGAETKTAKMSSEEKAKKEEVYVASVNADKISRGYFNQYCQAQYRLAAKSDEVDDFKKFSPEDKAKLLESLVNHVLLLQDAKGRNIGASPGEVEAQINAFSKRFNSSGDLDGYLSKRKLSMDNLRNEATKNVIIGKIIKDVIPDVKTKLHVSDSDVAEYYNANVNKFGGKDLDSVKAHVKAGLKNKRKRALLNAFFLKLRENAIIEVFKDKI
ncbi:gliding motility protein MglA [hydrothermal vent metagenome]|uniref:Gliding motility protein MglA n=1 Tax=hydrothermal vent metagenome TaxID=652676 RepID=A0A3B1C0C7_9ZZZZ